MKNIVAFLFLFIGVGSVQADCAMSGMDFFPRQKEISLNPMFIVQGYSRSQKTIESFGSRKAYLKDAEGQITELQLVEVLKGRRGVSQALFKVSGTLLPDRRYTLHFEGETEAEAAEMQRNDPSTGKRERVYWQTGTVNEQPAPDPATKITYVSNKWQVFGCGDAANAIFKSKAGGKNEIWYKAELVENKTGEKTVFYIPSEEGKLRVGFDMCGGPFSYARKGTYKVRFTPTSIDGKQGAITQWMTFKSPYETEKAFGG